MDAYVEFNVKVRLDMTGDELAALRDLVGLATEYSEAQKFPLTESQAKVVGGVINAYMQLPGRS